MSTYLEFIDSRDEHYRKKSAKSDYDYSLNFNLAKENNQKLNLNIPDFEFDTNFSCVNETENKIREDIMKVIQESVFEQSITAGNCFKFSEIAQEALQKNLNITSIITLGSVSPNKTGIKFFYESFEKLEYRIKNKEYRSNGINLHAWLTLPDYFIIDVSLLSMLKIFGSYNHLSNNKAYYLNSKVQGGFGEGYSYHPILLGIDYIKQININPIRII